MRNGIIDIDNKVCKGCGLCTKYCVRGCIVMGKEFGPSGYLSPEFTPGKCTACGICARMCPDYAIEVYDTGEGDKDK